MASHGRFRALDGMLRESRVDLDDFYPDALATSRCSGVQFGIPVLATAELQVYRRDLLLAAGVTPPRTVEAAVDCPGNLGGQNMALDAVQPLGRVAFVGESRETTIRSGEQLIHKQISLMGRWYFGTAKYDEITRAIKERGIDL